MPTIDAAVALGRQYHQAGDLVQAEQTYRQILHAYPDHADTLCLLGAACQALGKLDDAVTSCRRALFLRPDFAEAHNNLGIALARQGHLPEAVESFQQALKLKPDYPDGQRNLGIALARLHGRLTRSEPAPSPPADAAATRSDGTPAVPRERTLAAAVRQGQEVVRANPNSAEAHIKLGAALQQQGKLEEAGAYYREALR